MTAPLPDIAITLARFEVKLDAIIGSSSDHETRIRSLEKTIMDQPKNPDPKHTVVTLEMLIRAIAVLVGVATGVWVIPS